MVVETNEFGISEKIAPLPKRFHFSSSRAKLLALAELTPQAVDGKTLKVGELLGLQGSYAIRRLISTSSAPENGFIVEPQAFSQFRNYLLNSQTNWKKIQLNNCFECFVNIHLGFIVLSAFI